MKRNNDLKKTLSITFAVLFLAFGVTGSISVGQNIVNIKGNTLFVGGSEPGNYTSIQNAIDNATDGDTVFVYSGIYFECLDIDKSILLIGEDKDSTIIHGYAPEDEEFPAVVLFPVDGAVISGFTIENTTDGIMAYSMYHSSANNCSISDIIFRSNKGIGVDIFLEGSTNMKIHDNILNHGILIYETFDNTIEDNVIHGKPLIYLENQSDQTITNAGQVILNRCENTTIMNLEISDTCSGIQLYKSDYSYIYNNIFTNNYIGIEVRSNYNLFEQNTIIDNEYGILLTSQKWNTIFHNNFISNINQVGGFFSSYNIWYNISTKGGNYWDDYDGVDNNGDGIGDTSYAVWSNEEDIYPFMNQDGWLNNPPNKPSQPQGEINGKAGNEYYYTTTTNDVDGDQIWFKWSWGDDSQSEWIGPYNTSDTCEATHIWDEKDDYEIKVKAKDEHGIESEWSDSLAVSMPKNKVIRFPFLKWLQHYFPLLSLAFS